MSNMGDDTHGDVFFLQRKAGTGKAIEGTSVGHYHISQVISALEQRRRDQLHLYRHSEDQAVALELRRDQCIRVIEASAKHDEPKRIEKAQILKAAGTSAGKRVLPSMMVFFC